MLLSIVSNNAKHLQTTCFYWLLKSLMNVPNLMFDLCVTVHVFIDKCVLKSLHSEAAEPDLKQAVGMTRRDLGSGPQNPKCGASTELRWEPGMLFRDAGASSQPWDVEGAGPCSESNAPSLGMC